MLCQLQEFKNRRRQRRWPLWRRRLRTLFGSECRGNSILEFALLGPLLIVMSLGLITTGMALNRYLTVIQVARNAGNMYSREVDFSIDQNKQLLVRSAGGLNMTTAGGQGVIYLSMVTKASTPGSVNEGRLVIVERFVIGNPSVASSTVGTPLSNIWPDPSCRVPCGDVNNYEEQLSARATLPSSMTTIQQDEFVFVAEVFHQPTDILFASSGFFSPDYMGTRVFF